MGGPLFVGVTSGAGNLIQSASESMSPDPFSLFGYAKFVVENGKVVMPITKPSTTAAEIVVSDFKRPG